MIIYLLGDAHIFVRCDDFLHNLPNSLIVMPMLSSSKSDDSYVDCPSAIGIFSHGIGISGVNYKKIARH